MTYKEAKEELEMIISEIENGDADIDTLSEKIKRAGELLNFCKTKLHKTEEDVKEILNSFDNENKNDE